MAAFQSYLQSGKQRKVGWVGDESHVVFGKKFPGEKRKCETVFCHDATVSSFVAKVQAKSLHILMQLPYNVTVVCGFD
jgi:hypothetical protein